MSALVIASWIPAGALAEHGGDRDHGGGEHGGGDHGGGDHGGGDHGGGDHGGGDHGGGDHGGGDHGGGDRGGGDDHGGGASDGGSDGHGGSDGGSDDHGGSDGGKDDHGGSGSDDHGGSGSGDHGGSGSDDHGGSSGGSDDHGSGGGSEDHSGSDSGSEDHGSGGSGSGDDHGGSSESGSSSSDDKGGATASQGESAGASAAVREGVDIAFDRTGREYRSGELVVFGDARTVAAAEKLGLTVRDRQELPSLGGSVLRLEAPAGRSAEAVLTALKAAAPEAASDLNSVYRPAATSFGPAPPPGPGAHGARAVVGVADTSVDLSVPGLARNVIETRSFAPGGAESPLHGTVVASLVTRSGADVIAADVFSADRAGNPAASADAIARALDWLLSRGVSVVNLSLAGPPNAALAEVIRRAQVRGGVVVAAAGNGGPAAPPAYPAAYPGVVAVTAVDGSGRVYRYANQGGYIVVAARGVDLTPMPGHTLSGTSYASPTVAAMLARQHIVRGPRASALAIEQLRRQARDLGAPGRDPVFGYGLVGSAGF